MKKLNINFELLKYIVFIIILLIIFLNSLGNIFEKRHKIFNRIIDPLNNNQIEDVAKREAAKKAAALKGEHDHMMHKGRVDQRYLINPLAPSGRQIPPLNIKDLKLEDNSEIMGQWSAPIDWNVTAIHSILLPDETVMTFGSFGIDKKENDKDIRSSKKITITDGRVLDRDAGSY